MLVVSILLVILFAWRQILLNKHEGDGTKPPPLTPARLFARSRGQLLALYISAIFVWGGLDVGDSLSDGESQS